MSQILFAKLTVSLTEKTSDGSIIESEMDLEFCPKSYKILPNQKVRFAMEGGAVSSTMTRYHAEKLVPKKKKS